MTVRELIELLQQEDPDRLVVLSRDGEGNGFSPLYSIERSRYDKVEQNSRLDELTPELLARGYGEADMLEGADVVQSVTLWPR